MILLFILNISVSFFIPSFSVLFKEKLPNQNHFKSLYACFLSRPDSLLTLLLETCVWHDDAILELLTALHESLNLIQRAAVHDRFLLNIVARYWVSLFISSHSGFLMKYTLFTEMLSKDRHRCHSHSLSFCFFRWSVISSLAFVYYPLVDKRGSWK